jgi:hypothetical protein
MKFYAVAHITNRSLDLLNVEKAIRAGVDGVFFINHGVSPERTLDVAAAAYKCFPDLWIGVNMLGTRPENIFARLPSYVKGLWTDDAGTPLKNGDSDELAKLVIRAKHESGWSGEYFGGVAFKYQKQPADVRVAASLAAPFMDVVTTSGPGTGHAPDPEKIRAMREGVGQKGLAVASGVTPDNISLFSQATHILAATGVSTSFDELDEQKMIRLVEEIRRLSA